MADAAFYENCWAELLKASRAWQLHYDVEQLLLHICRTAHELLGFDRSVAFLLDENGIAARAHWPQGADGIEPQNLAIARNVIESGRSTFVQNSSGAASTILCAPLTATREILGALYLSTSQPDRNITEKDQQFFSMFASQAAACLEHTLLYQSAIADPLTGLFCHRHFRQEVDQAIRRAARSEQAVALLLMDLDHFKALNDTCGHEAGNQCLLQVASILRANFRATDILARFGGDEFEILLLDATLEDGCAVAEKVRVKIGQIALPQSKRVTATIGIAAYPLHAVDAQSLFLRADSALYAAKESGRDRVSVFSGYPGDAHARDSGSEERAVRLIGAAPAEADDGRRSPQKSGAVEMVDGHIVQRRLGVGSSGEVLLVTQPGLDREVALKRPLTAHQSFEQTQVFEREAKVTAGLNHPGIVPIFNIGRDHDSRRYYTMKPLNGRTLAEIFEARRKGDMNVLHTYTPGRLLEILQRVSETVAYAHAQKVLHLDLTPGNVLVGEFGEVTVIDWSTGSYSRPEEPDGAGVRLVGSPSFVAPELLSGRRNSSDKCDSFALGTLLYYLLTDELPFKRATTAASIDALMKGDFVPPDVLKPDSGIDPLLSELCADALSVNPARRPGAAAFAARLGLFLRGEVEWTTFRFGPDDHPLVESEWLILSGQWRLDGDHWVTTAATEGNLAFSLPVPGSFRFVCEGWVEDPDAELSIFGHHSQKQMFVPHGYYAQFNAEYGTVNKLARHEYDVLMYPGFKCEPGRRYRLELEYQDQDGMVYGALNGKRIFSYREVFPFPGSLVGFYTCSRGVHFKPIELRRQNWNFQLPAIRAADRVFEEGYYATALDCYQEIAAQIPDRLQGIEATLKSGVCLGNLGRFQEAFDMLAKTKGSMFEPFALAEKAVFQLQERTSGAVQRGRDTFRELFQRFPESQARHRIYGVSRRGPMLFANATSQQEIVEALLEFNHAATVCFSTACQSHISTASRAAFFRMNLGLWQEALEEYRAAVEHYGEPQKRDQYYNAPFLILSLALDRPELFPRHIIFDDAKGIPDWNTGILLHHAVHWDLVDHWLTQGKLQPLTKLLLLLAKGDSTQALPIVASQTHVDPQPFHHVGTWIGVTIAESLRGELLEKYVGIFKPVMPEAVQTVCAYRAIMERDFVAAEHELQDCKAPPNQYAWRINVVLKAMLFSLGYLKGLNRAQLREEAFRIQTGTWLDLTLMFLGERDPIPGKLWPGPRWHPEWRLLLALWLEAKGERAAARAIVLPSRDARYGLTHAQPAIEALLKRT